MRRGHRHLLRGPHAPAHRSSATGQRRRPAAARPRPPDSWLWKGRRVYLVDTTVSMPDTRADQAAFPQLRARSQAWGSHRPPGDPDRALDGPGPEFVMAATRGKRRERRALFPEEARRPEGGGRGRRRPLFRLVFHVAELSRRGVDGAFRMHQKRKCDFRRRRTWGGRPRRNGPACAARLDERGGIRVYPGVMRIRELSIRVPCWAIVRAT